MTAAEHGTYDDSLRDSTCAGARLEPQLVVAIECDRPRSSAARFSLAGVNEVILGRSEARSVTRTSRHGYTTMRVGLPARSMSSTHARLVRAQGTWILEDAGSRNGSFLNGRRIERFAVSDKDVIEAGHVLLLLRERVEMVDGPADVDAAASHHEPGWGTLLPRLESELAALERMAQSRVPVLLLGETGTGKELLARNLHRLSKRSGDLVAINCGALPSSLVESHLFGHVKGAFSGSTRDERGFVRCADAGTLFLDEVGDLPAAPQAALLRILQEGEVIPVGATRPIRVDVRVVSATHRSLDGAGAASFRPDLFARLAGFTFRVPPLRERIEDLGLILADLLAMIAPGAGDGVTLTPELGRALLHHAWPLNVRELQQALAAALVLAQDGSLRPSHFPGLPAASMPAAVQSDTEEPLDDEAMRLRAALIQRLEQHEGNVAAVARAMRKAPMQVHRWMKRFRIDPKQFRRR
jgi:DNA-binding NtrC family response regulator